MQSMELNAGSDLLCIYSYILTHIHMHKYGYTCTYTTTILIIASHTRVDLHYWSSKYCMGHLRAWSSQVWTVTISILEKYSKNIPSITVLYTIKGVSCCNSGQSQWSWVPIQTKSKVKVQTGIEKSLLCHRSKIEKGPQLMVRKNFWGSRYVLSCHSKQWLPPKKDHFNIPSNVRSVPTSFALTLVSHQSHNVHTANRHLRGSGAAVVGKKARLRTKWH